MAQINTSPPARYTDIIGEIQDRPLGLTLPSDVLGAAARRTYAAGLTSTEAAIRICHEHDRRLSPQLVEENRTASDLTELMLANRLEEIAALARKIGQDILQLLPDLPDLVRQPCFSDEFREMVAKVATWHGLPEHRWNVPDGHARGLRAVNA